MRISGKTAADELAGRVGDTAPVFYWCEGVVCYEDCLHFFEVGVAVEWGVAAEEEVGYHAYRPDVTIRSELVHRVGLE